ncbi:patatin-like phospholipase family protein [Dichotomicrobium thermohalophilum]|uniref:NTE family protein n=1 Tax=Dichotomicrobium thermohalophilum TaxID=933063 RepID=A0A397QD00_9HYPH|nr:patatin-like phospholipase family protein [Dichotomicrobium thermohalophilum]RIA55964.1 NTE family protein [Dichotomicrobium thermohalophilum]
MSDPAPDAKPVNLALQGGGSHGAFTWGVLDRLLEDGRIRLDAISGTSAGAMSGVVMADGYMQNGYDGARENLGRFWRAVADNAMLNPLKRSPIDVFMGNWSVSQSPALIFMEMFQSTISPYMFNPLNINPLADILESVVDFERVRSCDDIKLFVSATNVETGRVKVFNRHELRCEMVMASAALPFLFQAVEVDGKPYWDGGYMGNPALFPFYDHEVESDDIVIVQINPVERPGTPKTARDIMERLREITFNSSLLKELRSVDFINRLMDEGKMAEDGFRRMRIHIIEAPEEMTSLGASSRMNPQWEFLHHLFELGRDAADTWLAQHFDDIGTRETVDIRTLFGELGATHVG